MTTYDQAVGFDAAILYDGGASAAVDLTPSQNLRFEVAFTTDPYFATPAYVDLSDRVHLPSGITIRRGRGDEFETTQAGTMSLTLENTDGALTPDRAASPFYPYVLPMRRCRLTYRDPATYGTRNLIATENASFEGGTVGSWGAVAGAAIANSTTHADVGTKALRITWPTGGVPWAQLVATDLSIGRVYTVRARVWSATGVPDIKLGVYGLTNGTATSTKNAFATISHTFTATSSSHILLVVPNSSTTAGQQTWVDAVMLDETPTGTTMGTFTTMSPYDALSPVVLGRFDGFVDEWPVQWPDLGDSYSRAQISAVDLLARIGRGRKLRSLPVEQLGLSLPVVHFPLGEPSNSTSVASVAGDVAVLNLEQMGTGGTVSFAEGKGVPSDGLAAPMWASAGPTAGKYLTGVIPPLGPKVWTAGTGITLSVAYTSTSTLGDAAVSLSDDRGNILSISYANGSGNATALLRLRGVTSVPFAADTTKATNDGRTHILAARVTSDGTSKVIEIFVDGELLGSSAPITANLGQFRRLTIGGQQGIQVLSQGTISHVVAWGAPLDNAVITDHSDALLTGYAGERADTRLARLATWIGLPAERCNFDVGVSKTIGHVDTTGLSALDYGQRIVATEGGVLFAGVDGRLTFHNRARTTMAWSTDRTNTISNSSFEAGITGWAAVAGASLFAADYLGYDGSSSLRIDTSTAGDGARLTELVPASPGEVWTASAYAMTADGASGFRVRIECLDAAGTLLLSNTSAGTPLFVRPWLRESVSITAPAGTARVSMVILQTTTAAFLSIFADAALLERSATVAPYINGRRAFVSIPADIVDVTMAKNLQAVTNDVTVSREGGGSARAVDEASVDAYGPITDDITLVSTSDADVAAFAAWRVNTTSRPIMRLAQLDVDAYTTAASGALIRGGVDMSARLEVTGMPSQAPASTLRQSVQGYTETITDSSWLLSINATPYEYLVGLVLDDPVFGALDTYPLAY